MGADDCIFCKIVAGQIPAAKIYEDEIVLAFLDIGPVSDCPPELLGEVGSRLGRIAGAVASAMECDGYNLLCNNGRAAGQLVEHLHFHIIPRNVGDGVFNRWAGYKYPDGKIEAIAESIRKNL